MVWRSVHLHMRKLVPRQIIFHYGMTVSNWANHTGFQHCVVTTCIRSVLLRCKYVLGATGSHMFVCSSSHVAISMCPAHRCYTKGQSAKSATASNRMKRYGSLNMHRVRPRDSVLMFPTGPQARASGAKPQTILEWVYGNLLHVFTSEPRRWRERLTGCFAIRLSV